MPNHDQHPLWQLLDQIQMDHRQLGTRIVELRAHFAQLPLERAEHAKCPHCGIPSRSQRRLAEHIYNNHDGPLPDHWAEADQRLANAENERATPLDVVDSTNTRGEAA